MNNFTKYTNREVEYFKKFINDTEWLTEYIKEVYRDNTSLHDLIMVTADNKKFTIEVKEDEHYWFSRTGNIGLDYISAFNYKNYMYKNNFPNLWVPSNEINNFEKNIVVHKYGKLITCDSDLQFYFVVDKTSNKFIFSKLYSNKKLQSEHFLSYLKNNYDLRINDKARYGLADNWESAAFFVNPLKDLELIKCEVNTLNEIED